MSTKRQRSFPGGPLQKRGSDSTERPKPPPRTTWWRESGPARFALAPRSLKVPGRCVLLPRLPLWRGKSLSRSPRFLRVRRWLLRAIRQLGSDLRQAALAWVDDDVTMHAASISYYTVFSLAPILVIALAAAGMVFRPDTVQREVMTQLSGLMGQDAANGVGEFVKSASGSTSHGVIATILGVLTLVAGAIGAFVQLQDSLNHIWKVPQQSGGVRVLLTRRLLSFGLVMGVAFLLLASLVLSAFLGATGALLGDRIAGLTVAIHLASGVSSFVIIGALFAATFKWLPDATIRWKDVVGPAIVTSALFAGGKQLISLYIGQAGIASAYGAAGSLAVLLVWVFYSSLIVLFGAEFARVVSTRRAKARR